MNSEPKYFRYVCERTKGKATIQITPSLTLKAYVKKHGKVETKTVKDTKEDADILIEWVDEVHGALRRTGMPPTWQLNKKYTVKMVCKKYLDECDPSLQDKLALQRLVDHPFGELPLSDHKLVNAAHSFLNERLKTGTFQGKGWKKAKPVKASTVKREYNLYNAMFNKARREQWWGLHNIPNPFEGYKFDGDTDTPRERRLGPGEQEKIEAAFKGLRGMNRYYVPLAFFLSIETGMHEQEIFGLKWKHVWPIDRRRIRIHNHKTRKKTGRKTVPIVMPLVVWYLLSHLHMTLDETNPNEYPFTDHLIFPPVAPKTGKQAETYQGAFSNAFDGVLERSGINDGVDNDEDRLRFADMRHEAANRLRKAGLVEEERAHQLGHVDKKNMPRRYAHVKEELMEDIQIKLDCHFLNGKEVCDIEECLPASILEFILEHENQMSRSIRIEAAQKKEAEAIRNRQTLARASGIMAGPGLAQAFGGRAPDEAEVAEAREVYEQEMEKRRQGFRSKKLSECKLTPNTVKALKLCSLYATNLGYLEKYWYHVIAHRKLDREAANEIRHLLTTLGFEVPTVEDMEEEKRQRDQSMKLSRELIARGH